METTELILYSTNKSHFVLSEFEEAYYNSKRQYSINHLAITGDISIENTFEALNKALRLCHLAGINSKHHFKKIYVYDPQNETVMIDYRLSKRAFNLLMMQSQSLNESVAKWLWELTDL